MTPLGVNTPSLQSWHWSTVPGPYWAELTSSGDRYSRIPLQRSVQGAVASIWPDGTTLTTSWYYAGSVGYTPFNQVSTGVCPIPMTYNIYAAQSDPGPVPYGPSVAIEPWPWDTSTASWTHIPGTGVSRTNGSATVTATNGDTSFSAQVLAGDTYIFDGQLSTYYTVSSLDSTTPDTKLTLTTPFTGPTGTELRMFGPFNRPYRQSEYPGGGDTRILALAADPTTGIPSVLYEDYGLYATWNDTTSQWEWTAEGGMKWDLATGAQRPDGWTSTMAAGLPEMPFLVRYDEILSGAITHPLRGIIGTGLGCTNQAAWPGTHGVVGAVTLIDDSYVKWVEWTLGYLLMGSRLRLNAAWWAANQASFTSSYVRVICEAMVNYGIWITDQTGGSSLQIDAAPDDRWVQAQTLQLWTIPLSAFDLLDTVKPAVSYTVSPGPWTTGNPITLNVTCTETRNTNFNTNLLPSWSADAGNTWSQAGMSGLYNYGGRYLAILNSPSTYSLSFTWTPTTPGYYVLNLTGSNLTIAAIGLSNPYWLAPANLSLSVSETTRHMTTTQAGRWDNPATWGGAAPPTYGDYATVTYPVLIIGNTTIGDGTRSTVLTVSGAGSLTVIGATLTIRGTSSGSIAPVNSAGITASIQYE